MRKDSFPEFYYEVLNDAGFNAMLFGFLAAWWPLRFEPNVLFMHFADMKRDHNGALNKIASFLEIEPTESQWHAIQEYTSFNWMKQHDDKFSSIGDLEVPILETGAMIRKGQVGSAKEDGMNEEISKHIYAIGKEICSDPDALTWFYKGGDISRQSC